MFFPLFLVLSLLVSFLRALFLILANGTFQRLLQLLKIRSLIKRFTTFLIGSYHLSLELFFRLLNVAKAILNQ